MRKLSKMLLPIFALSLVGCDKEAASIGIIGGADGPTAIFVTSNINLTNLLAVCGIIALIAALIIILIIIYRRKKNK